MTDRHEVQGLTAASIVLSSGNIRDLQLTANVSDSQAVVITVELSADPASMVIGSFDSSNDLNPTAAGPESSVIASIGGSNNLHPTAADSESVVADASELDLEMTVENSFDTEHVAESSVPHLTQTFREFIPTPTVSATSSEAPRRKRKVGHACVLTESPYQRMLSEPKQQKLETERRKEARKAKALVNKFEKELSKRMKLLGNVTEKCEDESHKISKKQELIKNKKLQKSGQKKSCVKQKKSSKTKDVNSTATAGLDNVACYECGIVKASTADVNLGEDWIQCCKAGCGAWCHESCGEKGGLLDDVEFFF